MSSVALIGRAVLFIALIGVCFAQQNNSLSLEDQHKFEELCKKYGYVSGTTTYSAFRHMHSTQNSVVRLYQGYFDMPQTGVLTKELLDKMLTTGRCGVKENGEGGIGPLSITRRKRYALSGKKWPKLQLTYRILNYSPDLPRSVIDSQLEKAFDMWEMHSMLTFVRTTSGSADIEVRFARRSHGDRNPFDGPGGTLAHAFFPTNGDIHFDEDERFAAGGSSGVDILWVAVHEIGHAIGIAHSSSSNAVMKPVYTGYVAGFSLYADDINAVQVLYGNCGGFRASSTTSSERACRYVDRVTTRTCRKTESYKCGSWWRRRRTCYRTVTTTCSTPSYKYNCHSNFYLSGTVCKRKCGGCYGSPSRDRACYKQVSETYRCVKTQSYKCGIFGWKRCTRRVTAVCTRYRTKYECCGGYRLSGSMCYRNTAG